MDFSFVKTLRVKEAHVKILNAGGENDLECESMYFTNTNNEFGDTNPTAKTFDTLDIENYDSDKNVDDFDLKADNFDNFTILDIDSFVDKQNQKSLSIKKSESISVNKLFNEEEGEEKNAVKFVKKKSAANKKDNFIYKRSRVLLFHS